ncbi:hypothetical protein SAMN04490356_0901 [Streptomyces melanosporofaciens]|uniref:Uncharacterized protein n=1 Tax=Streptomyces melanosporofaciens TaxID=67327 RepID=A0A1H4KQ95_STRMJ|nr:hypothetical protein SAMN04490356_0901 [Streptomyces melanosporofaciens]
MQSPELRRWGVVFADQQVEIVDGDEDVRSWLRAVLLGEEGDDQGPDGVERSGANQPQAAGARQIQGEGLAILGADDPPLFRQRGPGRPLYWCCDASRVRTRVGRVGGVGKVGLVVGDAEGADYGGDGEVLASAATGAVAHAAPPPY